MKLNMGSKKNMGALTTLALVIVLTQSRAFDFLTESPLGRLLLLACIVFIAYTSKFFGLMAVLFIIIAYNQYGMNIVSGNSFLEGLKLLRSPNNDMSPEVRQQQESTESTQSTSLRRNNFSRPANFVPRGNRPQTPEGREGFVMTDREAMILRGKQSNTIPVFENAREQNDDVSPSDTTVFVSDFSSV